VSRRDADGHAAQQNNNTWESLEGDGGWSIGSLAGWHEDSLGSAPLTGIPAAVAQADLMAYEAQVNAAFAATSQAQQQNVPMSSSTYKTANGAATAALDAVIGQSEKSGWEYAGRIVKLANRKYAYTSPTTEESSTTSDPDGGMKQGTRIPAGTTDAGSYHTHPTSCALCAHDQFGPADNGYSVRDKVPMYMESGATRSIYMLPVRPSILDPTPPTVIRYGPPQ
jgi:hypothetical protein